MALLVVAIDKLPEDEEDHPIVAELDELQTYIGRKLTKSGFG